MTEQQKEMMQDMLREQRKAAKEGGRPRGSKVRYEDEKNFRKTGVPSDRQTRKVLEKATRATPGQMRKTPTAGQGGPDLAAVRMVGSRGKRVEDQVVESLDDE